MLSEEVTKFLDGVVGVVEANTFEHHVLWMMHAEEAKKFGYYPDYWKLPWKNTDSGLGYVIGHLDNRPVNLSLRTAVIGTRKILFYEVVSEVVDHKMVREWLDRNLPAARRTGTEHLEHADAQNFHNVI